MYLMGNKEKEDWLGRSNEQGAESFYDYLSALLCNTTIYDVPLALCCTIQLGMVLPYLIEM